MVVMVGGDGKIFGFTHSIYTEEPNKYIAEYHLRTFAFFFVHFLFSCCFFVVINIRLTMKRFVCFALVCIQLARPYSLFTPDFLGTSCSRVTRGLL